ncbi:MAG: VWA domain-containing protein [Candidatus Thermoplasmatota archaeon]|nr:VWA domain-containing protein [Candidatus Thermoplasmatota archaeon]
MKQGKNNGAVSAIIGTILLLFIALLAVSVIYLYVHSIDGPLNQKFVTVIGTVEGTDMVLEHRGGENIAIEDIKLHIMFMNETLEIDLEEHFSLEARADGFWGLGERIVIPFPLENLSYENYENIRADIMAVDEQMNAVMFIGDLNLDVVSDVAVSLTVNNTSPHPGENVLFTVTVSNPVGIFDARNVSISFLLPGAFSYVSSSAEQGSYNENTGTWHIGDLELRGDSIKLNVTATFIEFEEKEHFTQLCLLIDGSASIDDEDWDIMRRGLSEALNDSSIFPHNETVELTVIQFARDVATLDIDPIIISSSNYVNVAQSLATLSQRGGRTPLAPGLKLAADTLYDSPNFQPDHRRVINIITDGMPNVDCSDDPGIYTGNNVDFDTGKESAVEWRNYLINKLSMDEDKDEITSIAVGILSETFDGPDSAWLNSSIIWPPPGCIAPPFDGGRSWVREVEYWEELAEAINEMFRMIFQGIWIICELSDSTFTDPNSTNNRAIVFIYPP